MHLLNGIKSIFKRNKNKSAGGDEDIYSEENGAAINNAGEGGDGKNKSGENNRSNGVNEGNYSAGYSMDSFINSNVGGDSYGIKTGLFSAIQGKKINKTTLDELEELLLTSDLGTTITDDILSFLRKNRFDKTITADDLKKIVYDRLLKSFDGVENDFNDFLDGDRKPLVLLFIGVNGSGKTTMMGKMANGFKKRDKKVLMAACDTFRAAAVEQLTIWKQRADVDIITADRINEDPAALAYRALNRARVGDYDMLMIDTAGRLQNNSNLMAELGKIANTLKKLDPNISLKTLLTLDATTGQNSLRQFEEFQKSVAIDAIIMNKMDGTSRGGMLVNLVEKFKKPIYVLGIGEGIDDVVDFNPEKFLKKLLEMR